MKPVLRRIRREREGSATVEFALLIPALGLVLGIALEISAMLLAEGLLDSAALKTARIASTGHTEDGRSREQTVQAFLARETFGVLSPDRIVFSPKSFPSYAALDSNPDGGATGFGGPNDVVQYSFRYPWEGLTPLLQTVIGSQTLSASVVIRNEPFE